MMIKKMKISVITQNISKIIENRILDIVLRGRGNKIQSQKNNPNSISL